ncbi:MAG: hypothetical protein AAF432_14920 [Planctomycetota bacterium]
MKKVNLLIAPAAAAAFFATDAFATGDVIEVDITGFQSFGAQGSALNSVVSLNLGAGAVVTGIGWGLTLQSGGTIGDGASWQNEATFAFTDVLGAATGVTVTPAAGTTFSTPGTGAFSSGGILKLADAGIPDIALADGILEIEFFETFDDPFGDSGATQDAEILQGTLFIQVLIPAPAGLALLGAAGFAGRGRRRRG